MWRTSNNRVATCDNDVDHIGAQVLLLSTWLNENPLINARKDFGSIMFFLKSCKYDVERTKKKIKIYYLMRAERTEWFENRDPFLPEVQALLKLGVFLPVDGVDEMNRKIVVVRAAVHDPQMHLQNNVFKVGKMVLDLLIKLESDSCANGISAIFDLGGVTLGHALQLTPKIIKRSVESWKAYPCQPKLLEFINCPPHVNFILNTFRFFMTPKMRSRVSVQKNHNCSIKYKSLPPELGGDGPNYEAMARKWKHLVEHNADFYKEDDQYKSIISPS